MLDFLLRFFGREPKPSKSVAKERLRMVLIHDRTGVSTKLLEELRGEIIKVLSKYLDIDTASLEMDLTQENDSVALVANIPILGVKRKFKEEAEAAIEA